MAANILASLTAAAMALPAIATAAQSETKNIEVGFKHHNYQEDDLVPATTIGSLERYEIKANQFQIKAQISEGLSAALNYQSETMSGASPWYTIKNGEGEVVQVMSGASIKDKRQDISADVKYKWQQHSLGFIAAHSDEDDYESLSLGASYQWETDDKLSTWALGADFSNDDLSPVDTQLFSTRPDSGSKHSASVLLSYSRILSKQAMMQFSLGYIDKSGYLSDPYKVVFVASELIADARPQNRSATTFAAKLRYFAEPVNGALHLDYRYYDDDWKVNSHTLELAWYQNLPLGMQLVPSLRLYSQSEAYFYQHFYDTSRSDGYYSTDYRLSEYGAITYGLRLQKSFDDVSLNVQMENYQSGGDKGLSNADDQNPALLDFSLVSLGVSYRF